MTPSHILTRIGWAAGGLAVASATVIGSAGSAAAGSGLTIDGSPMPVQVGGTYYVEDDVLSTSGATTYVGSSNPLAHPNSIYLYDNGQCVLHDMIGANGTGIKSLKWTPMSAGTHTLQVREDWSMKTLTVTVEPAPPGTTIPTPTSSGCGDTGSFGS